MFMHERLSLGYEGKNRRLQKISAWIHYPLFEMKVYFEHLFFSGPVLSTATTSHLSEWSTSIPDVSFDGRCQLSTQLSVHQWRMLSDPFHQCDVSRLPPNTAAHLFLRIVQQELSTKHIMLRRNLLRLQ